MEIKNYTRDNIDFGRNYTQYSEMTPSESTFLSETIKDSGAKKNCRNRSRCRHIFPYDFRHNKKY